MRLNWFNYLFIPQDGYGRLGLQFVKALLRLGHEVHPWTVDAVAAPPWFQQAQGLDLSYASVMMMPPHEMLSVPGRNFAFTMHESLALPEGWAEAVNETSQWLLVPSPWLIPLFSEAGVRVPIEVVPGGIDPEECPIMFQNRHRPFTFGCLGDRGNRKGWDVVYTAFYKAFEHNNRDVRLLLKCRPASLPGLDFSYSSDPRFTIWKADVDNVSDIYTYMDAFMFPSRCEGFGMPPREASACGVPTVVTRYSGTADDCDHWAMPLEKFKMVESGMTGCGGLWAEPDIDEVVETMRWLYTHQDDAKLQALKSAKWLRDHATTTHAAEKLVRTLSAALGGPVPENVPAPVVKRPSNGRVHVEELARV